jgi:hypothetical protein
VSNQNQPYDVVGVTTWLKRWDECRKCKDDMTVKQELDLGGRAKNVRNMGRVIPPIHLPLKKSVGVVHAKCR